MHPLIQLLAPLLVLIVLLPDLWRHVPLDMVLPLLAPAAAVVLGLGLLFHLLARWWGWHELVARFPDREPGDARTWSYRDIRFGAVSGFNGIICLQANADGLRVSVPFPFSLTLKPFYVPWSEIRGVEQYQVFFRRAFVRLLLQRTTLSLSFDRDLAKEILQEMPKPITQADPPRQDV